MAQNTDRALTGVLLMVGFCLVAPVIDVTSKLAAQTLPAGMVALVRFIGQAIFMLPVMIVLAGPFALGGRALGLVVLRAAAFALSTYTFVAALAVMPIAEALAIAFVDSFILLLLGRFVLGEKVGPRRIAAAGVGFFGTILVVQPSFAEFGPVALLPLATAFFFALYMLVTRGLAPLMHPVPMQFHTAWIAALLWGLIVLATAGTDLPGLGLAMPTGQVWIWLVLLGFSSAVSHLMISYALRLAPSTTIAPLHYLEIASAAVLSFLVFRDFPDATTWTGIGIIVASGLYIIHRERLQHRATRARAR
jgi:drug/metabolite transporter (DMT)-like permease